MFSHYNMTKTLKAIQKLHYNSKNIHKKKHNVNKQNIVNKPWYISSFYKLKNCYHSLLNNHM